MSVCEGFVVFRESSFSFELKGKDEKMIPSIKKLILLIMLWKILTVASQERCIVEYFLEQENSLFACDFQTIRKLSAENSNDYKCVHLFGLPNITVCGEVGLRFELTSDAIDSTISLRYFSDREDSFEIIETDGKYGWMHWSKVICANFVNGVSEFF